MLTYSTCLSFATFCLAFLTYSGLLKRVYGPKSDIPFASHWIPWFGCIFQYLRLGPRAFLEARSVELGPDFGFKICGLRVVMLSSPGMLSTFFKEDRRQSFSVIDGQQMHIMAGYRAQPDRYDHIYKLIHQRVFRALYPAFSLNKIQCDRSHINSILLQQINSSLLNNTDPNGTLPLTLFTREVVFKTITSYFYGTSFPDIFNDSNVLDKHMAVIMLGLESVVPSAVRARGRVYDSFAAHFAKNWKDVGDGYLDGSASFVSEIIREMKAGGLSHEEIARYLIPITWGATSNLMSVCSWVMGHLLGDNDLYKSVAHEIRHTMDQFSSGEIDSHKISPYLNSVIEEVVRTKNQIPLMRVAQRDVVLTDHHREIHIHKGDFVAPNSPYLSICADKFDHPLDFKADRFINQSVSKSLYVFGEGRHSCAGMHLALHIIRMVVAFSITSFDITLSPSSDKVLKESHISLSPWLKASNELLVKFSPRSSGPTIGSESL